MNIEQFKELLKMEGFGEITTVTREPGGSMDDHKHPFEAKALILAGDIKIKIDGAERIYGPGELFHLFKNEEHAEWYGEQGVTYLVGRK
jgi:quercetin dioxygenase-like cupin family protein